MNPTPSASGQPAAIPLWPTGALDTTGKELPEEITTLQDGLRVIRNVSTPTLTAYLPDPAAATGAAVVVAPGGAYHFLAYEHEGIDVARWLNGRGLAAFLLKYRLVQTGEDFPRCIGENLNDPAKHEQFVTPLFPKITADGCRAVQVVRERAAEWGLAPNRIGIMGFSAGGMVTLSTALHYDASSRPDFAAPIYSAPPTEAPVPKDAPPLFLLCAADDGMASAVSTSYTSKWRLAGRPVELHIYAKGGHGFGMRTQDLPSDRWIERFAEWLQEMNF